MPSVQSFTIRALSLSVMLSARPSAQGRLVVLSVPPGAHHQNDKVGKKSSLRTSVTQWNIIWGITCWGSPDMSPQEMNPWEVRVISDWEPNLPTQSLTHSTARNVTIYSKETAEENLFKMYLFPLVWSFVSSTAALWIFHASCVLQLILWAPSLSAEGVHDFSIIKRPLIKY